MHLQLGSKQEPHSGWTSHSHLPHRVALANPTLQVRKQKAVYHTLNKLNIDVTSKVLIAEAWMPTFATAAVQEALKSSAAMSSTQVRTVCCRLCH